ncbi:MAG: PAS domain S-box protein [Candidatus Omnitrophica bacterium]|nr:PAS domain S-box protein [Candidatus Omnitrophota bacterium]
MRKKYKILIIGAGKGGTALLELFRDDESVEIVGVADRDMNAPGIKLAETLGIEVSDDYTGFMGRKAIDEIINVTGSDDVQKELMADKPDEVDVLSGHGSEFLWRLVDKHKEAEVEFERLNETMLRLGEDFDENISIITESCGKALGGAAAFYNKTSEKGLCTAAQWQAPSGYSTELFPEGHLCFSIMKKAKKNELTVLSDLEKTGYAETDPGIRDFGWKAYAGCPVCFENECIGSLCVLFRESSELTEREKHMLRIFADIISREEKRAKALGDLKDSEERYRKLVEGVEHPIFVLDREGRYHFMNGTARHALGVFKGEYMGRTMWDFFPKEVADRQMSSVREAMDTGNRLIRETQAPVQGEVRWFQTTLQPLSDASGNCERVLGIAMDTTKRKAAEAAVEKTKNFLDKIINSVADPIFVKDRDHRWIVLNDAYCRFMGYPREDLIGRSDHDYFPKQEADVFWEKDELVFRTREENINEERFTDSRGEVHTIITKKSLYVDEEGRDILVGIIRDITALKDSQEEMQKQAKKFSLIFENSKDAILWVDPDSGKVINCNRAAENLLERGREEIVGESYKLFHPTEKGDEYEKIFRRHVQQGGESSLEGEVLTSSGQVKHVLMSSTTVDLGDQKIMQGIFHDITARKNIEAEKERQSRALDKINRELKWKIEELEAAMSHIKKLEGLVPICANCKKMRLEESDPRDPVSWISMEKYISERTEASFTHGLCPECVKKMYGDAMKKKGK